MAAFDDFDDAGGWRFDDLDDAGGWRFDDAGGWQRFMILMLPVDGGV